MDQYVVPLEPSRDSLKPIRRHRWKRSAIELNGRFESRYRHDISGLLMQSYSEIGAFPHSYHINGVQCQTHINRVANGMYMDLQGPIRKQGISALEFDSKGIYLASATKLGCLTVHDFESLYCQTLEISTCKLLRWCSLYGLFAHGSLQSQVFVGLEEDETRHLVHLSTDHQLDVVRWNLANQDEVACASMKSNEVLIFDVGYISSEPVEVLQKRHNINGHKGLSDIAFTSTDDSRLFASDMYGVIHLWDRRASDLPCLELTTNSRTTLNSIQLNEENQIIFGAGKLGVIYMWDLRGGRTSAAFQSHKEVYHPPLSSVKLASMLEKIEPLKAQADILSKEIHSVDLDPSCPHQLAFHLDDGWSGVLDIHNFQVTHIHCPPPAWLNGSNSTADLSYVRKPSWLPTYSIYAVGSSSDNGIHLLDFYPDSSSPCHVEYREDMKALSGDKNQRKQNMFVPLSEGVTACAAHPLNGTIIAGTKVCAYYSSPSQAIIPAGDFPKARVMPRRPLPEQRGRPLVVDGLNEVAYRCTHGLLINYPGGLV